MQPVIQIIPGVQPPPPPREEDLVVLTLTRTQAGRLKALLYATENSGRAILDRSSWNAACSKGRLSANMEGIEHVNDDIPDRPQGVERNKDYNG